MSKRLLAILVLTVSFIAPVTYAAKVFLNGVEITDVRGKNFDKVKTVRIDNNGDIHIDAPQYEVKVLESGGTAKSSSQPLKNENAKGLTEKYFVASQGPGARVQYKLIVAINDVTRMVIPAGKSTAIEEITDWLQPGKNSILVTAKKEIGPEGRASTASSDELSLLIGAGHEEKKTIKIHALKATFKCNASTTNTFTKQYTIYAE